MKDMAFLEFFKKRSVKIWCAVLVILLVLGALVFLAFFVKNDMIYGNQRFTLKIVRVESTGFWAEKKDLICEILRIRPGVTNLLTLDPASMRNRLLTRESSIESVAIHRVLPDTLQIRILERTPVGSVYGSVPPLLVDSKCILLLAERSMNIRRSLPVISGLTNVGQYPAGGEVKRFGPAVELIQLVNRSYPAIRILRISVYQEDRLECVVEYRSVRFLVTMPTQNLLRHMRELMTNLELIRKNRRSERRINLMFKNQAVLSR